MHIDPANLQVGGFSPILTDTLSEVFQVYTAKDFPGMRPSSALTRALKLQGCNIQVKKGNEKALARKRISPSSEDDDPEKAAKKLEEGVREDIHVLWVITMMGRLCIRWMGWNSGMALTV